MPNHPTERVVYGELSADIDVEIAPLILEIWKAGVPTSMSCQGDPDDEDRVWIEFQYDHHLLSFLHMVGRFDPDPDGMYNRMCPFWTNSAPDLNKDWWFNITIVDMCQDYKVTKPEQQVPRSEIGFYFVYSVQFPRSDLPLVLERMQEHNRRSD